jgi:hypothetical protein
MINRETAEGTAASRNTIPEAVEEQVFDAIRRAIQRTRYGSVEVTIHDSRVVQIERKEKTRFDRR